MIRSIFLGGLFACVSVAYGQQTMGDTKDCSKAKDATKRSKCFDANKSPSPSTPTNDERLTTKSWSNEPKSFLSVGLGSQIENTIAAICPHYLPEQNPLRRHDPFPSLDNSKWVRSGKPLCRIDRGPGVSVIYGYGMDQIDDVYVLSDENGVGRIRARFYSNSYQFLKEALIERFGAPTSVKPDTFLLKSGGILPSEVAVWSGDAVNMTIGSLTNRTVIDGITDFGEINVATTMYLNKSNQAESLNKRGAANRF